MDGGDLGVGGPRPNGDGAGVVAAPHDGLRPSNVRVHGQILGLIFAATDQDPEMATRRCRGNCGWGAQQAGMNI